jgi:hypothetical protein
MRYTLLALAFAAVLTPVAVSAQPIPPPGGPNGGPPPEVRAKLEQIRADAKANALKAISADHQTKIQAIITSFEAGSVTPKDAVQQIDGVLSPDETKALLDQEGKMREAQLAARPPSDSASPAPQSPERPRQASAGRFLLTLLASREKLRDAMRGQRPQ